MAKRPDKPLTEEEIEKMKADCTEDNLSASLRAQMEKERRAGGNGSDSAITEEEAEKFENAFKDPEFRKLMSEYVTEISDPKNRAEQDEYIRQLEAKEEVPEDKELIRVEKGFVVKFKHVKKKMIEHNKSENKPPPEKEKLFVNVVTSEKVGRPTSKAAKGGQQWSVPHTVGPLRMETDKGESLVPTLDVCFHPEALAMAARGSAFQRLVVDTAREGVENGFKRMKDDVFIDPGYHVLKGVRYKNGDPPVMVLAKKAKAKAKVEGVKKAKAKAEAEAKVEGVKKDATSKPAQTALKKGFMTAKKTTRKGKSAGSEGSDGSSTKTGGGGQRGGGTTKEGKAIPFYTISESGSFVVSDHTMESTNTTSASTRPKNLVVRIDLPLAKRAGELDLDVSEAKLTLNSIEGNKGGHDYSLDVRFSYPVVGDDGTAKWDKVNHVLTVTVPVVKAKGEDLGEKRVTEVEVVQVEENKKEKKEKKEKEKKEKGKTMKKESSTTSTSSKTEKSDAHSRWLSSQGDKSAPIPTPGGNGNGNGNGNANSGGRRDFAQDGILPTNNSAAEFFEITGERLDEDVDVDEANADAPEPPQEEKVHVEGEFTASDEFDGHREGYVFKFGKEGLGYYIDKPLHLKGETAATNAGIRKTTQKKVYFANKKGEGEGGESSTDEDKKVLTVINSMHYEFRQNDRTVTILVQVANIDKNSVVPAFTATSCCVKFKCKGSEAEKTFEIKKLFDKIVPGEARVDISTANAVIILRKVNEGTNWGSIFAPEGSAEEEKKGPDKSVITTEQLEDQLKAKAVISKKSKDLMFSLD